MMIGDPRLTTQIHQYEKQLQAVKQANHAADAAAHNPGVNDQKLYKVCVEFESLFVKQMLNSMKKTVEKGEILHGGYAEEIFEDMLYDEYALLMAKSSGFGIADMVYKQLMPEEAGIIIK